MSPAARRVKVVGSGEGSGEGDSGVGDGVVTGNGVRVGFKVCEVAGTGESGRSSRSNSEEHEVRNKEIIIKKTMIIVYFLLIVAL